MKSAAVPPNLCTTAATRPNSSFISSRKRSAPTAVAMSIEPTTLECDTVSVNPDDIAREITQSASGDIVIPEGVGFCQGPFVLVFSSFSASVRAAPGEGRRSRRSARSVARTNGLDRGPARRRLGAAGERCVNSVVVLEVSSVMYMGWGQASVSAAGHPFARVLGHGAVRGQHAGSIKTAATP